MLAWLNGTLVDEDAAGFSLRDRGSLLADGVFETLLALSGRLVWPQEHVARLFHGASVLGIPTPVSEAELPGILQQVLAANGLEMGRASVRVTLTRGPGPRGLAPPAKPRPTLVVTAAPGAPAAVPSTAIVARQVSRNERSVTSTLKTLAYVDNIVARQEAAAAGADDALLLSTTGAVACASAANVFLVEGRRIATPRTEDGALAGIARGMLIGALRGAGIQVAEERIDGERLDEAAAVLLTNSLIGARPLAALDGRRLPEDHLARTCAALLARAMGLPPAS